MMTGLKKYLLGAMGLFTILMPFFFYSSDMKSRQDLTFVEKLVGAVDTPVDAVFRFVTVHVGGVLDSYFFLVDAKAEAAALRRENAKLSIQLQVARELELENRRLRDLLHFNEQLGQEFLASRVLTRDPSYFYDSVRLARGSQDGVQTGMAVVAAKGAVGIVMRVRPHTAHVLLVSDPNSSIDVIVARNRRRGVLEGSAGSLMHLKHVGKGGRVQVGDVLLTSGLTGSFPRGIEVGRVVNIQLESDNVSQRVEVEPAVVFANLAEVLVLKNPSNEMEVISRLGGPGWMDKILRSGKTGGS